jgi:hypothetical protein
MEGQHLSIVGKKADSTIVEALVSTKDLTQALQPRGSSSITTPQGFLKTYTNRQYGFSFQYPPDWRVTYRGDLQVQMRPQDGGAFLAVWSGPVISHGVEWVGEECGRETVTLGGMKVLKEMRCGMIDPDTMQEIEERREARFIGMNFRKNGIEYGIDFSMKDAAAYVHEQALDKIVETFRFAGEGAPVSSTPTAWLPFRNERYGYSITYPADCPPGSNDLGVLDASQAMNVSFCSISIEPQDPEQYGDKYPDMKLPLREFAKNIWQLNKFDRNPYVQGKKVGPLIETTVGGRTAYQFSVDTSYTDYRGGSLLKGNSLAILFSHGNMNFIAISHDSVDSGTMQQMIGSLRFDQ